MKKLEKAQEKNKGYPHPLTEIPSSGSHCEIDLIALKAFKEAAEYPEMVF